MLHNINGVLLKMLSYNEIILAIVCQKRSGSNPDCSKMYSVSGGRNFKTFQEKLVHPRSYSHYPICVLFTALYPFFDSLFVIAVFVVQVLWIEVLYHSFSSYICQAYSCWVLTFAFYSLRAQVPSLENNSSEWLWVFKNTFKLSPFFLSQKQWLIS